MSSFVKTDHYWQALQTDNVLPNSKGLLQGHRSDIIAKRWVWTTRHPSDLAYFQDGKGRLG
ncbi:MAG: hypothetical protein COX20_00210 [Desulfobacterales bacterium CG23_combo_of_CG06-09_8_20_14_all_52_9]|nr:MAG: hypothetical protein COX20_00210 [Desulfobacterales bacterium CG23_combo_of_CG06-09_8_20_14_all_52_9]